MGNNNWEQKKKHASGLLHKLLDIWQGRLPLSQIEAIGPQANNSVLSLEIDNANLPLPYDDSKMSNQGMLADILAAKDRSGGPDDEISKNINAWIELINEYEPVSNQNVINKNANHAPDFRSVNWFGEQYSFTATQAACLKVLWNAWQNQTPEVGGETLLEQSGSEGNRVRDIFKNHSAWNTMILSGNTKGTFRLVSPSN